MPNDQFTFEQEYMAQYNPPEQPGRRRGDHVVVSTPHIVDAMTHMVSWINPLFYKPFEKILGRKYKCKDCKYHIFKGYCNECTFCSFDFKNFILSEKTRWIIDHIMREGDDLGIDVHPRYQIGGYVVEFSYDRENLKRKFKRTWEFIPTSKLADFAFKLVIFL